MPRSLTVFSSAAAKSKTIRTWVSEDVIPYRKANGKIIFLLAEILSWTLPANDETN